MSSSPGPSVVLHRTTEGIYVRSDIPHTIRKPLLDEIPSAEYGRLLPHLQAVVLTTDQYLYRARAAVLLAGWRKACPPEIALLAMASALGLTGIDIVYVYREAIPPIYLVDAGAEVLLLLTWSGTLLRGIR